MNYILDDTKNAVPVDDILEWARWFESADRIVARDESPEGIVSTVFLGIDHSFGQGPAMLFETMVFGGKFDGEQERYSTWQEAEAGHKDKLQKVVSR